ncbi:MAG TPA: hypothetical protein DCL44_05870 [Elusimicrobia bacterium]|nr:hypothetical protein [Elusimicrobiota bacterium]
MQTLKFMTALLLLSLPAASVSAGEGKWGAALIGGLLMEDEHSGVTVKEGPLAGAEVSRQMNEEIYLHFAFSLASSEKRSSLTPGVKYEFNNYFGTLCGTYRLDRILKGLYLGPQAAVITRAWTNKGGGGDSISMTGLGYGARIGYEHKLSGKFSSGLQGNYLKAAKAETTVKEGGADVTYSVPATSFTSLLVSLKYHF